jgi:CheY-like chemotaxis protein
MVETTCAVLVAEDHDDTGEMIRRALARRGVVAEIVGSAAALLERLEHAAPPRCIVLDEEMPGMTGLSLYRQLVARPEWKDIPVFFYTASYDARKQAEAEQLGARAWFVKGVTRMADLIQPIVDICGD